MATVLALVFVPALAAVGFMMMTALGSHSIGAYFMFACFTLLAGGMIVGLLRLVHQWENEPAGNS